MKVLARLLSAVLVALLVSQPLGAQILLTGAGRSAASGGTPIGSILGVTLTSAVWTSSTDLAPVSQFANGYTADVTLNATAPAGTLGAYNFGTAFTSPNIAIPVTRPGFSPAAAATTVSETVWGTAPLRQTYATETLPSEAANAGNAKVAIVLNDFVFGSDSAGPATTQAGLYTSGAVVSTATTGIPVTNNSTRVYPRPIGVFVTPPGERIGASQGFTAEFFGGHAFGKGGVPLAAVKFTVCDVGCAHSVTKTISTQTVSVRQVATTCTATNGSATLTSCANTYGMIVGARYSVIGIPGQPKLLSKTSTSLTFGSVQNCITTLNSGTIKISATPPVGSDAIGDGAFAGATISDVNITSPAGVATITANPLTSGTTTVAFVTTATDVVTTATATTAAASHACTVNHIFQGSTGTVTVTLGNPVPVFAANFTSGDFSALTDGLIYFRAQAYPVVGDVILDTQTGADGTGCDWFVGNVSGTGGAGVCDSGSPAWFNVNGTDISANLHNLWAYLDKAGTYAPAYVWVKPTGTCNTAACVSTSPTDPGGAVSNYASSEFNGQAALKAWMNTNRSHNDPMGGVVCTTAGTYLGWGGNMPLAIVALKPSMTITSATLGGDCSVAPSANSDVTGVIHGHNSTNSNNQAGPGTRVRNMTISDSSFSLYGSDTTLTTTFNSYYAIVDGVIARPTASVALFSKLGAWWVYNSLVDQIGGEGRVLTPSSSTSSAPALIAFNTLITGTQSTYNSVGNIAWNTKPNPPDYSVAYTPRPLSMVLGYNRWLALKGSNTSIAQQNNLLMTHEIVEITNSNVSPGLQISGDSAVGTVTNTVRQYTTVLGGRTNNQYLEGIPPMPSAVGSGGTFAAGTYYMLVAGSLISGPTAGVETSTDGIRRTGGVFAGTSVALNGSLTYFTPCGSPFNLYTYTIYLGTTPAGADRAATLGNYASLSGSDAVNIPACTSITMTSLGTAHTSISLAGTTSTNFLKSNFVERFNIDVNFNIKGDTFGGTTGQAGAMAGGGKVGNWEGRFNVSKFGNVAVTGSVVGGGLGPSGGLGDTAGWLFTSNPSNTQCDITWVLYKSDRSMGGECGTTPLAPALNLGMGDYHIDMSSTVCGGNPCAKNRVPAGYQSWPWDIEGKPRSNSGTDCAGAFTCWFLFGAARRRKRAANDNGGERRAA